MVKCADCDVGKIPNSDKSACSESLIQCRRMSSFHEFSGSWHLSESISLWVNIFIQLNKFFQTINNPVYPLLTPDTCKAGMYRTQSMLTCEACPVGSQANTAKTRCGKFLEFMINNQSMHLVKFEHMCYYNFFQCISVKILTLKTVALMKGWQREQR